MTAAGDTGSGEIGSRGIGSGGIEPGEREPISAKRFHEFDGLDDWRVLFWGAHVHYPVTGFAQAADLTAAIAEIAAELGHEPDVDLRPQGVTVRTTTGADGSLSTADVALAVAVQARARAMGLVGDPTKLAVVGIAVAEAEEVDTKPFWRAALGYVDLGDTDVVDPQRRNPHAMFHDLDPSRPGRGRTHIDISVPADQAQARVAACLAAGGRIADDSRAPMWWTLASPDNHGVDIAGWADHYEG